jgi:hypothetical protein
MTNRITEFEDAYQKRRAGPPVNEDEAPPLRCPAGPRSKRVTGEGAGDHLREPVYQPAQP